MTDNSVDKRRNKSIIANNGWLFKQYASKNYEVLGRGIIVVNLLLLKSDRLDELNLIDRDNIDREPTVHQPVSYIPQPNFWFKMISLKIKKKYQIDIQAEDDENKFLIVFIKDASIEHFSIYSIKIDRNKKTLSN